MNYEYGDDPQDDSASPARDGAFRGRLDQETFQALLFNSFLHQQTQVRERRFELDRLAALAETHRELRERRLDLRQSLGLITGRALEMTGATGAAIALASQGQMVCRAVSGMTCPPLGACLPPDTGVSGECLRSGRILRCDDTENDARVDRQACRALGSVRSLLLAPLRQHGNTIGIFELFSTEPQAFASSDEHVLELLGVLITAAVNELTETAALAAESGRGAAKGADAITTLDKAIAREHPAFFR